MQQAPATTESSQSETTDSQAEESKSRKSTRYGHDKMIFLVLLEAAMRAREMYFRDEIKDFTEIQRAAFEAYCDKNKIGFSKKQKMLTKINADNSSFENEYHKFNRMVYAEINKSVKEENQKTGSPFDNYSASWHKAAEEFVKAKNTTDMLTLMQSYNNGLFDEAIEAMKKEPEVKEIIANTEENGREQI